MRVEIYKKIKHWIGYLLIIIATIGMNGTIDGAGHKLSLFEAIVLAIIVYGLNSIMWSDWMYNHLIDTGAKINYLFYQKIGIFVLILFVIMLAAAAYAGHGNKTISLPTVFSVSIVIYLILVSLANSNSTNRSSKLRGR